MNEEDLKKALACFEPKPLEADLVWITEALLEIVSDYRHNAHQKHLVQRPFEMVGEDPEAYLARVTALAAMPRRRGRPVRTAQLILVWQLRDLLMKAGCHYGAPKPTRRRSRLVELAALIHAAVDAPQKRIGWRSLAERMADPVFFLDVVAGQYPKRQMKASPEAKAELAKVLKRTPKRKA